MPGFAIYVHWPFCVSKCPYCDFNSHVREQIDEDRWRRALLRELDHYADLTPGRTVNSVFFGGGTPSLMNPSSTAAIIDRIAERWTMASNLEITLEANPTSVEAGRFQGFRTAGVNRVSLGVQSLDPEALRFLGRAHGREEAITAIGIAQRHFDRMNFDLIYARPGQSPEAWQRELDEALSLAADHLSLYQLTIEAGTAFHAQHARGAFTLPDDDTAATLYEMTQEHLDRAGLAAYEISNHARPGSECRHNLTYWRYGDYVGLGPGAHGRLMIDRVKYATSQRRAPETWLTAVEEAGHGTAEQTRLSNEEQRTEFLMMGLRLVEGIPLMRFRAIMGGEPEQTLDARALEHMIEGGFLYRDDTHLGATAEGRVRLNALLTRLLPS